MSPWKSIRGKVLNLVTSDVVRSAYAGYLLPWLFLNKYYPIGTNIYSEEWDLAIILDACRVDALRAVQDEYEFLDEVDSRISLGSASKEWMLSTFRRKYSEEVAETTYVTANAWAENVLQPDTDFSNWTILSSTPIGNCERVDRLLSHPITTIDEFDDVIVQPLTENNGLRYHPAEQLTDMAIQAGRERDPERMIVHYMQPHGPFAHKAAAGEPSSEIEREGVTLLQRGHEKEPIWEGYLDNLRYVLDNVSDLLDNYDGDVLITADHGEAFGELGVYGHGEGVPHTHMKRVPWVHTTGTDQETKFPDEDLTTEPSVAVEERLSAMGYK